VLVEESVDTVLNLGPVLHQVQAVAEELSALYRLASLIYSASLEQGAFVAAALSTGNVGNYINGLVFTFLGAYVAFRLLSDRKILVKNTFLLLSIYFAVGFMSGLRDVILGSWNNPSWPPVINLFEVVSTTGVSGVAAYFFLSTYLEMRRRSTYELSLPLYVRGAVLLYGSYELFMTVFFTLFPLPWMRPYSSGVVVDSILFALGAMLPISYVLASLHSLRFSVGEEVTNVDSKELEI
jgi:hypothetical protein